MSQPGGLHRAFHVKIQESDQQLKEQTDEETHAAAEEFFAKQE